MAYTLAHTGLTTITFNTASVVTGYNIDMDGANVGPKQLPMWEELPNYAGGANVQVNVQRGRLIPVSIPLIVKGTSVSDLDTKLGALWTMVAACTYASPGTLTWDATGNFDIVASAQPDVIERNPLFQLRYIARFVLVLTRKPS